MDDNERRICVRLGALIALCGGAADQRAYSGTRKTAQIATPSNAVTALLGLAGAGALGSGILSGYLAHAIDASTRPSNKPSEERRLQAIRLFREAGARSEQELARV